MFETQRVPVCLSVWGPRQDPFSYLRKFSLWTLCDIRNIQSPRDAEDKVKLHLCVEFLNKLYAVHVAQNANEKPFHCHPLYEKKFFLN